MRTASPTVLIVSPYFPPSALAGVHRARHLARHLPLHGWHPRVLCVDERFHEQASDPALASLLPDDLDIIKVAAVDASVTRPFGLGEISLRAFRQLHAAVHGELRRKAVDVVLITGSPYYPMLLSAGIKRAGIPVVLDFQDPWVSNWGASQPLFSKSGLSHWLATRLEPRAVFSADFITSVSEQQNMQMRQRYPQLHGEQFAAIPIGGDPSDFDALRRVSGEIDTGMLDRSKINMSFVGTFMPRSGPLMQAFLKGVAKFRETFPDIARQVRFNFIGTGNHSGATERRVTEIARDVRVADLVFEVPQRIAFSRAMSALAQSDAVLLIGSDEPHYTASKIYPGLMCGRPFLSLFHKLSSSHAILQNAGGGAALAYDPDGVSHIGDEVCAALVRLVQNPQAFGKVNRKAFISFEASAIAGQFAAIFNRLHKCA